MIDYSIFKCFPTLETERLLLRAFNPGDKESLFGIRSNKAVMQYIDTDRPKKPEDVVPFLEKNISQFEKQTGVNWVIEDAKTSDFIGFIGIHKLDEVNHRGEIGYSLLPKYGGKGIMSESLQAVVRFAFTRLNLHGLDANVNPENKASQALLVKNGFRKEAHFKENYYYNGKYLDSFIYCLVSTNYPCK